MSNNASFILGFHFQSCFQTINVDLAAVLAFQTYIMSSVGNEKNLMSKLIIAATSMLIGLSFLSGACLIIDI